MTYELKPCPKPASRVKAKPPRTRKPLKRTKMRCGAGSKRRGKSSFPKQRHGDFTRWLVTENECLLAHRMTRRAIAPYDWIPWGGWFIHKCWGRIDPAHVGKHRSKGAPDFGHTVPLCRAAHSFYDEHRSEWESVTQFSEHKMASAASGYALAFVERGGTASPPRDQERK